MPVPTIFITGPMGVGKTAVASELSWIAEGAGIPHGGIDVDALMWVYPAAPPTTAYENVAAIWASYLQAGATHLILAQVLESRAALNGFRNAVPGAEITVFRLRAARETLFARVSEREKGGLGEPIHHRQAEELFDRMENAHVEDHVVETDDRSVRDVAAEIFELSAWGR